MKHKPMTAAEARTYMRNVQNSMFWDDTPAEAKRHRDVTKVMMMNVKTVSYILRLLPRFCAFHVIAKSSSPEGDE